MKYMHCFYECTGGLRACPRAVELAQMHRRTHARGPVPRPGGFPAGNGALLCRAGARRAPRGVVEGIIGDPEFPASLVE